MALRVPEVGGHIGGRASRGQLDTAVAEARDRFVVARAEFEGMVAAHQRGQFGASEALAHRISEFRVAAAEVHRLVNAFCVSRRSKALDD